nr:MAG TPA: hypothetical protein [Caudoviricetes sp.]
MASSPKATSRLSFLFMKIILSLPEGKPLNLGDKFVGLPPIWIV